MRFACILCAIATGECVMRKTAGCGPRGGHRASCAPAAARAECRALGGVAGTTWNEQLRYGLTVVMGGHGGGVVRVGYRCDQMRHVPLVPAFKMMRAAAPPALYATPQTTAPGAGTKPLWCVCTRGSVSARQRAGVLCTVVE